MRFSRESDAGGSSLRGIALCALVLAIGVSPRIPLPVFVPSRRFDLRIEDVLLTLILLVWSKDLFLGDKVRIPKLFRIFGLYLAVTAAVSVYSVVVRDLDPFRSLLYFGKEVEYGLLGLLAANWARTTKDLRAVLNTFVAAGIANAIWAGVQMATGANRTLFLLEPTSAGTFDNPTLLDSYGPQLIGEASAYQTGGFFLIVFLIALAGSQYARSQSAKYFCVGTAVITGTCIGLSGSRMSMIGAFVGAVALFFGSRLHKQHSLFRMTLVCAGMAALLSLVGLTTPDRLTDESFAYNTLDRVENYWTPLVEVTYPRLWIGFGAGSLGFLPDLSTEFAHNHYFRVAIESGIVGLVAFLATLAAIVSCARRVDRRGSLSLTHIIAAATHAATLAFMIEAFANDVFTPVLVNELWWLLIGLTAASERIETLSAPRRSTSKQPVAQLAPKTLQLDPEGSSLNGV